MTFVGYRIFTDLAHASEKYLQLETLEMSEISPVNGAAISMKRDQALREVAQKLEASFLAEMLKSAGLGKTSDHFGGGAGEEQFGSFLLQEQAMQMVKSGGIGLSESLFQALKEKQNDT